MFERTIATGRRAAIVCCASLLLIATAQAAGLTSADTDENGKISRAEANAAQDKAFKRLDTNADDQVDAQEFDSGQPGLPADADIQDKERRHRVISSWFKHIDADANGKISRSEYREALTPYFDRLDTDGDDALSADELKKAFGGVKKGGAQK
ncbi:hypothetical protein [Salinisphaera sp.]|uniref:EF-hand domain-containing protein n=1 Tax=Salinisphaera sp. TaxID=1914330 RepID=UPI002D77E8E7|nr:hypothetical protein [Salinisphaera sp.]HET7313975.1 hypothetical protein [Salinisphaera sp.]